MKILFLISYSLFVMNLFANEHRVVLHGHASHFKSTDRIDREFNEENYGIGYEYNTYDGVDNGDYFESFITFSANVIQDSYKKIFPFIGTGIELRTKGKYSIGVNLSGFVGYKKISRYNHNLNTDVYTEINREYIIVGGVTPGVKLYAGDFSFNYNYSPRFEYENIVAEGFHYFSLSYRFY